MITSCVVSCAFTGVVASCVLTSTPTSTITVARMNNNLRDLPMLFMMDLLVFSGTKSGPAVKATEHSPAGQATRSDNRVRLEKCRAMTHFGTLGRLCAEHTAG